jgi:hypothetical protein
VNLVRFFMTVSPIFPLSLNIYPLTNRQVTNDKSLMIS